MNILGCLDKPTGGSYRLDGIEVGARIDDDLARLRNQKIGFVFQQFHLLERTTAAKNVTLPLIYGDEYPENAAAMAEKALAAVGLADRTGYRPNELSGGQQQRVAIARALITDPEIILADEPTGALDRQSGLEVLAIFKRLHAEGKTIILVTHDQSVAEHAQRILRLHDGRLAGDNAVVKQRDPELELAGIAAGEDEK
jgi:putative ABC transport system ATP-binding protein